MADKQLVIDLTIKTGTMKQQINSINKEIKYMESEFKNAGAGVENFEKTSEGLSAKLKLQQSVLEKLKDKLSVYKQEQEKCTQTLDKAVSAYEKQQARVKELQSALEKAKATYGESSDEVKELEQSLIKANKALDTKKNSVINANNSLKNMNTTINSTEAEIKSMDSEIQKLNNELDNIDNNNVDELGNSFDKAGKDAVAFGAQMTIVGEGVRRVGESVSEAGKEIVSTMGELVKSGSEYSAEVAGTDFLLKNLDTTTEELINNSSELASSIGLTSKQYRDSATSIATYYKNMGYTTEETNNLTSETMNLVSDLGAITDMPFDDALSRFKSGLMGNYEALDAFGINISANTLQNSEFIKSLGQSWNSLDDNTKMTAVYKEIVRQSASATGLATQEAGQFGMQNKLLTQRIDELKGSIGEKLLPTLQPFLEKINEIVGAVSNWVEKNPELVTAITGVATAIGAILLVVGTLITTLGTAIIMWGAISTAMAGASIPFLAIAGVIAGVIAVVALLAGGIASNFEGIKSAIENLKTKFSENFGAIQETFNNTWTMMQDIYSSFIQPLFQNLGIFIEAIINFIADCMPGISTAFQIVFEIINAIWTSVGKPLADFIIEVFSGVVNWFVENLPFLSQVFNQVMNILSIVWNNVGKPLFDFIKNHIDYIITFLKPIILGLGTAFQIAFNVIKIAWNILYPVFEILVNIVSKIASVAINAMSKFQNAITSAMSAVLTPIQWVIDKISDLFGWLGNASSKIGGFIEKINPFKNMFRTFSVTPVMESMDTSNMVMPRMAMARTFSLDNIALSGSYYNANTRESVGATDMIRQVSGLGGGTNSDMQTSALENITKQFTQEINNLKAERSNDMSTLAKALESMSSAIKGLSVDLKEQIVVENKLDVVASFDPKKSSKELSPYLGKSVNKYSKLALG